MIGKVVSHYRIIDKLGEGGMGVVYKAEDLKLKRFVALKFLHQQLHDDSAAQRFIHEAQTVSALEHPNICALYEIDSTPEGQMFIVMPCYEGESLHKRIERGPLPIDEALEIGSQIASGLARAHEKGIVHRDIKPGNVLLTKDGAKIVDFGLAKLTTQTKLTRTGTTLGTVVYMSPEQARGVEVDHRSDIWSLGVILYEMVTGRPPFRGEYDQALIYSILNEEPELVTAVRKEVPAELEDIIAKALAKKLEERYQSAGDLLAALTALRQELSIGPEGQIGRRISRVARKRNRRKLLLRAGIPAAAALAVAAYFIVDSLLLRPTPLAERPKIAILAFENQTGDQANDIYREAIPNLLISSLEQQGDYLRVTTWERLHDLVRQIDQAQAAPIDREMGFRVCQMDSVDAVVTGSYTKAGDLFVTRVQVQNPRTKMSLGSASAEGRGIESILSSQIDDLSREIAKIVGISSHKIRKAAQPVADVTTKSSEAYKFFIEGKDYSEKYDFGEARRCFEKAIALDSTFATAYLYYARNVQREFQPQGTGKKHIALAMKHLDHANWKEQRYIIAADAGMRGDKDRAIRELASIVDRYPDEKHAYFALAQCQNSIPEAIPYARKALEIDPSFKNVYNALGYWYREIGDLENALVAANRYIELAPNEWNPYDSKGDIYLMMNMPEEALECYAQKDRVSGDSSGSYDAAEIWLLQGKVDKAERAFRRMAAEPGGGGADGRTYMAMTRMFEGRFNEALRMLEEGIELDKRDSVLGVLVHEQKFLEKAIIYLEFGDRAAAAKELLRCNVDAILPLGSWSRDMYFYIMGQLGGEPATDTVYRAWRDSLETPRMKMRADYWWAQGMIALSEGNAKQSVEYFRKNIELKGMNWFLDHYMLAQAYLQSGEPGEAIGELEKSLEFRESPLGGRLAYAHLSAKVYYQLGVTYEGAGIKSKSIENYRTFLEVWKNADPDRPEVRDAKRRLARLQT